MKEVTVPVFSFSELSEKAKETAKRYASNAVNLAMQDEVEALEAMLKLMGIERAHIRYSGFWNQGDGLSFTGHVHACTPILKRSLVKNYKENTYYAEVMAVVEKYLLAIESIYHNKDVFGSYSYIGEITRAGGRYVHQGSTYFRLDDYVYYTINYGRNRAELRQSFIEKKLHAVMDAMYKHLERTYGACTSDMWLSEQLEGWLFYDDGRLYSTEDE